MTFDGKAFGAEVVAAVKHYVRQQMLPLEARVAALEAEAGVKTSKPTVRVTAPTRQARP